MTSLQFRLMQPSWLCANALSAGNIFHISSLLKSRRTKLESGSVACYLLRCSCIAGVLYIMTSSTCHVIHKIAICSPCYFSRPANILLSKRKIPVLVDFGFAERYDTTSKRAFLSNLAYGTPEVCIVYVADLVQRLMEPCSVPFT